MRISASPRCDTPSNRSSTSSLGVQTDKEAGPHGRVLAWPRHSDGKPRSASVEHQVAEVILAPGAMSDPPADRWRRAAGQPGERSRDQGTGWAEGQLHHPQLAALQLVAHWRADQLVDRRL